MPRDRPPSPTEKGEGIGCASQGVMTGRTCDVFVTTEQFVKEEQLAELNLGKVGLPLIVVISIFKGKRQWEHGLFETRAFHENSCVFAVAIAP